MIKKFLFLFICVALVATIVGCSLHSGHGHGSANADLATTLSGTVRDDGTLAEITFASGAKVSAPTAGTMQPNVVVTVTESKTSDIGANAIGTPSYIYLYTITAILTSDNNLTEDVLVSSLEQPLNISLPTSYLGTNGICYVGIRFSEDEPWQYRVVSENGTIALNLRGKASSIPSECNIDLYRPNIQLALFVYDETTETASSTANIVVSEMTATSTPIINIADGVYQNDLTVKLALEGTNLNGLNASDLTAYVTFRSSNATAMTIKANGTNVTTIPASDKAVTGGANYTHTFKVPSLTFENQLGTTAELSFVINTKDMATSAFSNELLIELVGESEEVIGRKFVCADYFTFATNGGNTEPASEQEQTPSETSIADLTFDLGNGVKLYMNKVTKGDNVWYAGIYEVTQAQYKAVMNNDNPSNFSGDNKPVESVSWNDIMDNNAFMAKLNAQLAEQLSAKNVSDYIFNLPTQDQWEYTCRAGSNGDYSKDADGNDVTSGNLADYAWYSSNSNSTTQDVGTKKPNYWGFYDMHGNVLEWCADGVGTSRGIRGGSFSGVADECCSSYEDEYSTDAANDGIGFRVFLVPDPNVLTFDLGNNVELKMKKVPQSYYYAGIYEVTQAQYNAIMGTNPSEFSGDNKPVEKVSWNTIKVGQDSFMTKLNDEFATQLFNKGLIGYYFDLPSVEEWQYTCKAGTNGDYSKDADGNDVTADNLADYAWYGSNSDSTTHDVGTKKPNLWGFYDMHGNVKELCNDELASDRTICGGSYNVNAPILLKWGTNAFFSPSDVTSSVGFRVFLYPSMK